MRREKTWRSGRRKEKKLEANQQKKKKKLQSLLIKFMTVNVSTHYLPSSSHSSLQQLRFISEPSSLQGGVRWGQGQGLHRMGPGAFGTPVPGCGSAQLRRSAHLRAQAQHALQPSGGSRRSAGDAEEFPQRREGAQSCCQVIQRE